MKKIFYLLIVVCFLSGPQNVRAGLSDKFRVYFNQPVSTSVSSGTAANCINGSFMDTLIAYINNAKYTVDIAQYDYEQDGTYANLATAVNNAYTRGVRVRWIHDGAASNSGLSALNSGINTLGSPTSSNYNIMHNKFVIIDANAADSTTTWLNTGSADWSGDMMAYDYNNWLFIQSQQLAKAYTAEFNMMWGDTGAVPNSSTSLFGPYKTDLGQHNFTIDGIHVELYFSPSDGVNNQILNCIASADSQLFFGVYCFTESSNASSIISKFQSGVSTYGILDQYSQQASGGQYNTLSAALGSHLVEYVNANYYYHNKFMFVDPCAPASDPQVLTGSHNWTHSADEYNDENTLIIHDETITNMYYQSFYGNYTGLGGAITACETTSTGTGVNDLSAINIDIYPNPTSGNWQLQVPANIIGASCELYDINGKLVSSTIIQNTQSTIDANVSAGVYVLRVNKDGERLVRRVVKL